MQQILGFDPLSLANEEKLAAIGRVVRLAAPRVTMKTLRGASRIVDMPVGDQLPRVC